MLQKRMVMGLLHMLAFIFLVLLEERANGQMNSNLSQLSEKDRDLFEFMMAMREQEIVRDHAVHETENYIMSVIEGMMKENFWFRNLLNGSSCNDTIEFKTKIPNSRNKSNIKDTLRQMSDREAAEYALSVLNRLEHFERKSDRSMNERKTRLQNKNASKVRLRRLKQLLRSYQNEGLSFLGTKFIKLFEPSKAFSSLKASLFDKRNRTQNILILRALMYMKVRAEALKSNLVSMIFLEECASASDKDAVNDMKYRPYVHDLHRRYEAILFYLNASMYFAVQNYTEYHVENLASFTPILNIQVEKLKNRMITALDTAFPSLSFGIGAFHHNLGRDDVTSLTWNSLEYLNGQVDATGANCTFVVVWRDKDIKYGNSFTNDPFENITNVLNAIDDRRIAGMIDKLNDWIENNLLKSFKLYFYWILIVRKNVTHYVDTSNTMSRLSDLATKLSTEEAKLFSSHYRLHVAF